MKNFVLRVNAGFAAECTLHYLVYFYMNAVSNEHAWLWFLSLYSLLLGHGFCETQFRPKCVVKSLCVARRSCIDGLVLVYSSPRDVRVAKQFPARTLGEARRLHL